MNILPGMRGFARGLAVASLLALSAVAQDTEEPAAVPDAPAQAAVVTPPAKPEPAKTPEEQRLADLLKLKFDRSPAAILQALTAEPKGETPEARGLDEFRLHVVAGRWKEVGTFIKTLPEKQAAQVYEYVLKDLDRVPTSGANPQPQVNGPAPSPTLLQGDIAELADIAPADLNEAQLKLLGALLRRVLTANGFLDPLLARLQTGTVQLGGADPRKRERAAELLLNANRDLDAAKFLPALEPGKETGSFSLLEKHVRCAFTQGRTDARKEAIGRAWQLNERLLGAADCPPAFRERGWQRSVEIVPFLPTATAAQFLKDNFLKRPEHGLTMLTATGVQVAKDRLNRDLAQRKKNLELQQRVVEALLPVVEHRVQWQPALNLFAVNWMDEAAYAKRRYVPPRNQNAQYDEFGNQIEDGNQTNEQQSDPNQLPALPIADVLAAAPGETWLAALDPSLLPRALTLLTELNLKLESDTKALPFLEQVAPLQPKEAQRMANDLLRVWAGAHDPQRMAPQRRANTIYYINGMYQQERQGIPLTRALQQRNLEELSALLTRLRKMPIPPLDDAAIVSAFTIAHSQAEVFREESIENVLGKLDEMKPETLAELLQAMRQRLAGQWRKPNVQQQAKTQRSDAQIDAEVLRGYELLGGLLEKGITHQPENWRLHLAQAATWFDWAEFQYGKKVDLAIYVGKRDHAFDGFQRAADLYAASQPAREEKDETPAIYQQWLNANLGASDLGFVTRQQEPSAKHLDRIREAIAALPGAAGERHFAALAKAVVGSADSIPGNLKAGYMRAALSIVGERPESVDIRELVSYYDGLLREIEVSLRVDGDATVGHTQPFGVFLTVRHTAELERENSGGFSKYLRNQTRSGYYNSYGIAPVDHRDDLEKQMREKLSEGFDILSLTFHDEKVQSRGYGRPDWRETPLVYLLLKAKDASVDRIPSLRLDVDFVDKRGPVVLPVESPVLLIDAHPATTPPRPLAELEATQTLDDRLLKEGKLTLEIKATGKGVVPPFNDLFDFTPAGFKIDEQTDGGATVQRFDSEGEQLAGASERIWTIKLSADSSAGRTAVFQFPKPKQPGLKAAYKRYQDADLVEVPPELALAGLPLQPRQIWQWALAGILVLALICWLILRLRRRPAREEKAVTYSLPATVTPFTALELLRKMFADERLALSQEHRTELAESIAGIEAYYFARSSNGNAAPDLDSIGRHWITRAGDRAA